MKVRLALLLVLITAATLAIAGCGGDDDGGSGDRLGEFAPADASFYVEVAVKPEGDLKSSIESILERFPGGDQLGERLRGELDESLGEEGFSYSEDIEPWLGQSAAVVGGADASFEDGELSEDSFAIVVETSSEDEAVEKVREAAEKDDEVSEASYEGTDYFTTSGGGDQIGAFGALDGTLVLAATEQGFEEVVDTHAGDDTLSEDGDWQDFIGEQQGDSLVLAYADVGALIEAAEASGQASAADLEPLETLGAAAEEPVMLAVGVEESRASLDFSSGSFDVDDEAFEQSSLLERIPDEAWVGLGLGSVGQYVDTVLEQVRSLGKDRLSIDRVESMLRRETGIEFSDLTGLGDAAAFAAGTSIFELQVGFVVEAPDGSQRQRLLAAMERAIRAGGRVRVVPLQISGAEGFAAQLPGLPATVNVAASDDRIAIALGDRTTQDLLEGGGDSEALGDAAGALGDGFAVNLFVDVAPIVSLIENSGEGDDPDIAGAKPYLREFDSVVVGARRDGGRDTQRIVVELSD